MKLNAFKKAFPLSWHNTIISLFVLAAAFLASFLLKPVSGDDTYVLLIFIMAVMIVSLKTDGYFYGVMGALLSVVCVNYFFTFPYFSLDFSITGYPFTFAVMLTVSLVICTLATRLKRQERIRAESEKEIIRANLLRAVSHDLRTPLTSIVGATGAVLDNYDSLSRETKRELLNEVRDDAQWLIHMVENILSITRIGADPSKAEIVKHPEAVEEILSEALVKFKKLYPDTAVSVKVPDELMLVPMDAMLIEQVLLNIMENAIIHGVTTTEISVCVYRSDSEAIFEIADNGKGISPDVYARLFSDNLHQGRQQQADSKRNMGIGLSVCTSIIKAHGGTLTAMNIADSGGTKFCFTLPMKE